jgi:hypothetical protein
MESRHAAALALVGWYLMIPPTPWMSSDPPKSGINPQAPLSEWFLEQSFDTAKECERVREKKYVEGSRAMRVLAQSRQIEANPKRASFLFQEMFTRCISTNDPRLKDLPVEMSHWPFQTSPLKPKLPPIQGEPQGLKPK